MKIRSSFVSNSSSSSFIVIDNSGKYNIPDWSGILDVENREYGWGPERLDGIMDRITFSYLQAAYLQNKKLVKMLEDVIKENTKITQINWIANLDGDGLDYSYIDHQSCSTEDMNVEMFDSKDALKNFIFGTKSYIQLDNDNY
jgi:hypothetical protein